jgi:hypothetical protein
MNGNQFALDSAVELKRIDKKQYAKGMRYRATMWVHAGGDDQQLDMYANVRLTPEQVVKYLKRKRSRVLDDFAIYELKEDGSATQIYPPVIQRSPKSILKR